MRCFVWPFLHRNKFALLLLGLNASLLAGPILTGSIYVPNSSFESPRTDFADPRMDAWDKTPKPAWYQDPGGFAWEQLAGQFWNTPLGASNHIDNVDRAQAAFLFAVPELAIFQDHPGLSSTNADPALDAVYEPGRFYTLTVAVLGGGGGMSNGATLALSLYYRDAASNFVTVAATTVTNSSDLFPTNSRFGDFQVRTPIVQPTDPWFGKPIGIRIASTVGFDLQGGYWDIDNVRLTESALANDSFESPGTDFADPRLDDWQKSPKPAWYQADASFPWDQLTGQFLNTPPGASNHIDNVDGRQGAFLFALPDVALFQDSTSTNLPTAGGDLHLKFTPGKSYALTVALLGGGGGMSNGATFEISLYYRDSSNQFVTVAARTITNSAELFPTNTRLVDFQARTPIVQPTDAWAGKNIGVRLASTVGFDRQGGYWDVDQVRLTESVVPNGSFETPPTDFATPVMEAWQKDPEPAWYSGGASFPWGQLAGQFLNTPPGSSNHIDNVDGAQGAFLFALPEVAISQELPSLADTNHASMSFSGKFEPARAYGLTVAVLGGGGGMSNGATLEISLYYRDASNNIVPVTATTITNSAALFPTNTHFVDFRAVTPVVSPNDPWAGQPIGLRIASSTGFDRQGGYWDVDNVRLDVAQAPSLLGPQVTNGHFSATLESQPGRFEILSSSNVAAPLAAWTSLAIVTNLTGSTTFADPESSSRQRFYRVQPAP